MDEVCFGSHPGGGVVTASPTVAVIGAGPAALACVHRLREQPEVRVVVVAPGGASSLLAGVLPVLTGDARAESFTQSVALEGVEVVAVAADAIDTGRVRIAGDDMRVDAVVAAPGLSLDSVAAGGRGHQQVVAAWDLPTAQEAASAVSSFASGRIDVVVSSRLYRCPPAPYGLALRLARRAEANGWPIEVRLVTPEPQPVAAIGGVVSEHLLASCAEAGVEIAFDVQLDPEALGSGVLRQTSGEPVDSDLAVVIPPHRVNPLLAELVETDPLVSVDAWGRVGVDGIYAAGDVVAAPFPRAAAPAAVSGIAAAHGALADLGFDVEEPSMLPAPDCFVDQGNGRYSRIRISYPAGRPPEGQPSVVVDPAAPAADSGFDEAVARWRGMCG